MAAPAQPLLASTLYKSAVPEPGPGSSTDSQQARSPSTGLSSADEALKGCVQYGAITCISAQADSGGQELTLGLLISHLLSSPIASATIIDTGASADIRKINRALLSRLSDHVDAKQQALAVLNRLKIMRVFDFEGLADATAEVRQRLCDLPAPPARQSHFQPPPRGTIGDSDGEDDDELLSPDSATSDQTHDLSSAAALAPPGIFLLIDNLSQLAAPPIKNNYTQGQGLLVSFMRSLMHLAQTHSVCTIVVNGTSSYANAKEESPSAFSSCTQQPLLGKAFMHVLDTHLLLHQIEGSNGMGMQDQDRVSIIEVLQDRHGQRAGRWAAFNTSKDGTLLDVAV